MHTLTTLSQLTKSQTNISLSHHCYVRGSNTRIGSKDKLFGLTNRERGLRFCKVWFVVCFTTHTTRPLHHLIRCCKLPLFSFNSYVTYLSFSRLACISHFVKTLQNFKSHITQAHISPRHHLERGLYFRFLTYNIFIFYDNLYLRTKLNKTSLTCMNFET